MRRGLVCTSLLSSIAALAAVVFFAGAAGAQTLLDPGWQMGYPASPYGGNPGAVADGGFLQYTFASGRPPVPPGYASAPPVYYRTVTVPQRPYQPAPVYYQTMQAPTARGYQTPPVYYQQQPAAMPQRPYQPGTVSYQAAQQQAAYQAQQQAAYQAQQQAAYQAQQQAAYQAQQQAAYQAQQQAAYQAQQQAAYQAQQQAAYQAQQQAAYQAQQQAAYQAQQQAAYQAQQGAAYQAQAQRAYQPAPQGMYQAQAEPATAYQPQPPSVQPLVSPPAAANPSLPSGLLAFFGRSQPTPVGPAPVMAAAPAPAAAPPAELQVARFDPAAGYGPTGYADMAHQPIDPKYERQIVDYPTDQPPGTIVIDTPHYFLYLVMNGGKALRYGIGVGRPGFAWAGEKQISAMREWPDWYPPDDMLRRRPDLPKYMAGGPNNPLGARALYLGSTLYRIHGSNEPWTIGTQVSSGCIRLRNEDVVDLYGRVKVGTKVIVI